MRERPYRASSVEGVLAADCAAALAHPVASGDLVEAAEALVVVPVDLAPRLITADALAHPLGDRDQVPVDLEEPPHLGAVELLAPLLRSLNQEEATDNKESTTQ